MGTLPFANTSGEGGFTTPKGLRQRRPAPSSMGFPGVMSSLHLTAQHFLSSEKKGSKPRVEALAVPPSDLISLYGVTVPFENRMSIPDPLPTHGAGGDFPK